jgi:MoaA/NifB/PqqE/SkfB family radical SAM enzyme
MPPSAQKLANIRTFHQELNSPRQDGFTANAPLLLGIEATTRCNFKCVHCSQTFNTRVPLDLSLDLFQRILPVVGKAHELYLFGDGEVLLDMPRHLAMIAAIYQQDPECILGFSTNGKLLTPEVYELYATAGIHYIQLSVDAATRDLYETIRRGGDFDELVANLEGIAALRKRSSTRQPQLRLATVISRQNYEQLPLLADFARRYDFSYWYINAEYPHNPGRDLLQLTADDLTVLARIKADITRNYGTYYLTLFDPCVGLAANMAEKWMDADLPVYCTVPWQRFELKVNGDVKLCPYYHEPICSMNAKSLLEIWNGNEFRAIRKAFATGIGIPTYCVGCNRGLRRQYLPGFPGLPDPEIHCESGLHPAGAKTRTEPARRRGSIWRRLLPPGVRP